MVHPRDETSGQEAAGTVATTSRVGEGRTPQGKVVGWTRNDAMLLTPIQMEPQTPAPRGAHQHTGRRSDRIWPEIFLNCGTGGQDSNDQGHRKTTNKGSPNTGQGCMGCMGDGRTRQHPGGGTQGLHPQW